MLWLITTVRTLAQRKMAAFVSGTFCLHCEDAAAIFINIWFLRKKTPFSSWSSRDTSLVSSAGRLRANSCIIHPQALFILRGAGGEDARAFSPAARRDGLFKGSRGASAGPEPRPPLLHCVFVDKRLIFPSLINKNIV